MAMTLVKVNVDKFGTISAGFEVSSIPHVVLVKGDETVQQFVGLIPEANLDEFFNLIK